MRPTPESEEFEALRRLLQLKRYEQPPPGYFQEFPRQVLAQIRAGRLAEADSLWERLNWEAPWLTRLLESFQTRPALAMGFGGAVCAFLVAGLIYSERLESHPPRPVTFVPVSETPVAAVPAAPGAIPGLGLANPSEVALLTPGTNGSLNPVLPAGGSLFDHFRVTAQPVAFPGAVSP